MLSGTSTSSTGSSGHCMMPMATKVATSTSERGDMAVRAARRRHADPEHHPDRGGGDAAHDGRKAGQRDEVVIDGGGRDHDHERRR